MREFTKYKKRVLDYLKLKNIEILKGNRCRCFGHFHKDERPSCQVWSRGFHCHACGITGDIYDAVLLLENLPERKRQYDFLEKFFKEAGNA